MEYHVHTRYSQWHRLRVQMAGGIIAALLPYLIRLALIWQNPAFDTGGGNGVQTLHMTFAISLVAILAGTMIMRSMGNYPGVEGSASILPVFSATFGLSLLFFVMGRLEYNRSALAGSYVLTLIWFYLIHSLDQRRSLRIGILPGATTEIPFTEVKRVEAVYLSDPDDRPASINAIAADFRVNMSPGWERRLADDALAGVPVFHIKHLVESLTGQVALEHLSETSYGTLSPPAAYVRIKQIFDWLMAGVAAVMLSPLLLIIAIIIRSDSPGPAIFYQRRVGYRGHSFTVYKFRTMTHSRGAIEGERDAITRSDDARITRVGAFLRRSRLDELPQIFNILLGDMSWIGPRPEAEVLSRWYEKEIPFYRYRHIVRPGITGWAQVNQGHVAEVLEVTSKLHYDFYYIKNCSPWIDILIVVRTIKTMITGFGAR